MKISSSRSPYKNAVSTLIMSASQPLVSIKQIAIQNATLLITGVKLLEKSTPAICVYPIAHSRAQRRLLFLMQKTHLHPIKSLLAKIFEFL